MGLHDRPSSLVLATKRLLHKIGCLEKFPSLEGVAHVRDSVGSRMVQSLSARPLIGVRSCWLPRPGVSIRLYEANVWAQSASSWLAILTAILAGPTEVGNRPKALS